jgi:phospholipid/cholesterol/gamma-HCH transport system permease protein
MIYRIGYAATLFWQCLLLYGRILIARERLDLPRFSRDSHELGLEILPVVTVIAATAGGILGVQAHSLLQTVDVPYLVMGIVAGSVVRELSPLLIGLLVASRSGVALAVRIGTMVGRQEIDGLIVSGINPVQYTVGATLLAVLTMSFALVIWAQLIMFLATGLSLSVVDAIPPGLFIDAITDTISAGDLLLSVAKTLLFGLLVTLIAATEGSSVSRRPDAISRAATRTMLQGIAWILLVDLLFVVQSL